MKFLLDQGLGRGTADHLRGAGYDAAHIAALGMATASDEDILARAAAQSQVIVTLDADFHAILALSGAATPSAIRVRVEGLNAQEAALLILRVAVLCEADLLAGALVSVDLHAVRVRRLPIRP